MPSVPTSSAPSRAPRHDEPASRLQRLGTASARHPLAVVAAWALLLVLALAARHVAGGVFSDNVDLPGTQASAGANLLTANEPGASGYTGQVVLHVSSGTLNAESTAIAQSLAALQRLPHVVSVSNPLVPGSPALSADGRTAYATLHLDVEPRTLGTGYVTSLGQAMAPARAGGVEVEYGNGLQDITRPAPSDLRGEAIGFAVALVVLLLTFGSVLGAALPLLTALVGVGMGLAILSLVAGVLTFGTASPTLAAMIGLGVGIDYALFLTTRYRQAIMDGEDPVAAAGRTVGTSGHAVLVAASTVSVALLGLYASGITFIGQLGLAAVFTVAVAAMGAVTLVPAGLALAGRRIDRYAVRAPVAEPGASGGGAWRRYAYLVARRPWWFLAGGVLVLAILTVPLFSVQLGHVDNGADPTSFTDKRAYDLVAQAFGPGANGQLTVVVDTRHATRSPALLAGTVRQALAAVPDVAHVSPLQPSPNGALLVGTVVPATSPQDAATATLFQRLVNTTLPAALSGSGASGYVTGDTAAQLEFRDTLVSRLPIIIAVVVLTAFALIILAFRSLLLALKAALLNLLSIGASAGFVVAVFQWGWGRGLLGLSENVPIESYVPMMMFAIIFGLSMDYEVFLLSRVKEAWEATRDNSEAVAAGLASTARVISAAALIMASVFIAFVASTQVVIKMLAVGLAASVLIDATVIRLVLVPATMALLGRTNWWLPAWLDRILPHLDVEGRGSATPGEQPGKAPDAQPGPHGAATGSDAVPGVARG
jgi:RND superfamily putative drug exporter